MLCVCPCIFASVCLCITCMCLRWMLGTILYFCSSLFTQAKSLSQTQSADMACFTIQFILGIPFSPLSEAGIIGAHCAHGAFKWLLGIQIRSSHLHSKCFNHWTISQPITLLIFNNNSNTILALVCTSVWFQDALPCPILDAESYFKFTV